MQPLVLPLDAPEAREPSLVGEKGASLARLLAAGLPVPPGFCLTTRAFADFLDGAGARVRALASLDVEDAHAVAEAGAALRAQLEAQPLPAEVERALGEALAASGPGAAWAVRSSATAEDLPEASFAGQHDTFLDVRGPEAVRLAVRRCMASLYTDRALTYRARQGLRHERVALAVVVQRMVPADAAGVLFTADPLTGHRFVTAIDAAPGLGEALVAGRVTPEQVRVDVRDGRILGGRGGVRPHAAAEAGSPRAAAPAPGARVLSDAEVRTLAALGQRVQAVHGVPQDVEWCREGGRFFVLQARPITSLFPLPSPLPRDGALHVYQSFNHRQGMTDAVPPLVADVWCRFLPLGKRRSSTARSPWAATAGGRVYVDTTPLLTRRFTRRRILAQMPRADERMALAMEELVRRPGFGGGPRVSLPELLRWFPPGYVGAFTALLFRSPERFAREERGWLERHMDRAAAAIHARPTAPARLEGALEAMCRLTSTIVSHVMPILAGAIAEAALRRLLPHDGADVDAIGRGFALDVITQMNLALGDVGDVARAHPHVAAALRAGRGLDALAHEEGGAAFREALGGFLAEYGFRAYREIDFSRPRWREEPTPLLQALRGNLAHATPGLHRAELRRLDAQAQAAARRLEARAARGLLGPLRRALVRRLVRAARNYLGLREHPKYGVARLLAELRAQVLEAGRALAAAGVLGAAEDVWYLEWEELTAALREPASVPRERLRERVAERRRAHAHHARLEAPAILTSEGEAPVVHLRREHVPAGALVGTPVGGGVVEGTARVLKDPVGAALEKGEVLVAPYVEPGWTPLFLNAAGLVVDVGGQLTHGSIVAREYGIPTVVSVEGATSRLRSGQRVRVDGSRGLVEVLG